MPDCGQPMGHAIPDDGYTHIESLDCPCHPVIHSIPWIAVGVCHRSMALSCPDTFPEGWCAK